MRDEFKKLLNFFELGTEEKAGKLEEVFEDASIFLERFKEVFEKGTPEEKKEIMGKVVALQKKVQDETEKLTEQTGLSAEQVMQFAMNPNNFSEDQWNLISENKEKLEAQAKEIQETLGHKSQATEKEDQPKKKKGGGRKDWMAG